MPEWKSEPTKRKCDYHTEYYYRKHKANITYKVLDYGPYKFYRFKWGNDPYQIVYDKPLKKWTITGGRVGGNRLADEEIYGLPSRIDEVEFINSLRADGGYSCYNEYWYSGSGTPRKPWGIFRRSLRDDYSSFLYIFTPEWKRPSWGYRSSLYTLCNNSYSTVIIPKPKSKLKKWIVKWTVKLLKKIHADEKKKS